MTVMFEMQFCFLKFDVKTKNVLHTSEKVLSVSVMLRVLVMF